MRVGMFDALQHAVGWHQRVFAGPDEPNATCDWQPDGNSGRHGSKGGRDAERHSRPPRQTSAAPTEGPAVMDQRLAHGADYFHRDAHPGRARVASKPRRVESDTPGQVRREVALFLVWFAAVMLFGTGLARFMAL